MAETPAGVQIQVDHTNYWVSHSHPITKKITMSNYNTAPDNMVELTEKEWAQSDYFIFDPEQVESRQFIIKSLDDRDYFHSFKLYTMHEGHGYAITHDYWAGRVRVFRFGCNHNWVGLSSEQSAELGIRHFGNCYHVQKCENCDKVRQYDSSG